jgi:fructose-bisphosphate aldolase class II
LAEAYGATVILHTTTVQKIITLVDGLLDASEAHFAKTGKPLYSSHMIDLSENQLKKHQICKGYLERMSKMGMTEIELGITGGEEDGVDNSDVDVQNYTRNQKKLLMLELSKISPRLQLQPLGNVHGVYKPGNVKLTQNLENSQFLFKINSTGHNPVDFVFPRWIRIYLKKSERCYGVIKMNIDTDLQFAFEGIRDYMVKILITKTQMVTKVLVL